MSDWRQRRRAWIIFLCDHASRAVPEELGTLGLPEKTLAGHISSDLGAGALTRAVAKRLDAPAVLSRFSRLVVDLNRGADDPTVVAQLSDGHIVPGNHDLTRVQIAERIARYHAPYHAAIESRIAAARAQGIVPVLVSIHSFTPVWRGDARPGMSACCGIATGAWRGL